MIPRIPVAAPVIGREELANVSRAVRSGWISSKGKFVGEFESGLASVSTARHAVATSNGTTALHLALLALNLKAGDEVIIPDLTFAATANAVLYCGAKPVLVDVDPRTYCITADAIRGAITKRTRGIIPVHLYGHPAPMDSIRDLADEKDLWLVEDAAEALGAKVNQQPVGSWGTIGVFSFYANKIITTGEGGMCVTNRLDLAEKMRILRDHGMDPNRRYWHTMVGFNYRITNLQAAVGVAQLAKLESFIRRKRQIAKWYNEELDETPGLVEPVEESWARHVYWMYSPLVQRREALAKHLASRGIETRPFFHPLSSMPPYRPAQNNPVSYRLANSGINLPSSVNLSASKVGEVARHVKAFLGGRGRRARSK